MIRLASIAATVALAVGVGWLAGGQSALAQPTRLCASCLAQAKCDDTDQSCAAACVARYFTVDPRRPDCIARCSTTLSQCKGGALTNCREQKACR